MKQDTLTRLEPYKYYHIYNQGNNQCNIFYNDGNYEYFLKKYSSYLLPYIDTFCYCLLPNHFHFLINIKSPTIIIENHIKSLNGNTFPALQTYLEKDKLASEIVSDMFRRFFMSYSKAFNKQHKQSGSLFRKNFKRKEILNEQHLKQIVYYIHRNPWHHGICDDFVKYKWSSYSKIIKKENDLLNTNQCIDIFDNEENFIFYHKQRIEIDETLEISE